MSSQITPHGLVCVLGVVTETVSRPSIDSAEFDELLVTNDSVRQVNTLDETKYLVDLSNGQELEKLDKSTSEILKLFRAHTHYLVNLSGHVFSAFLYLLTVNYTFRNSFLVQMSHQISKQNSCATLPLAYIQIGLFMPQKIEVDYKA